MGCVRERYRCRSAEAVQRTLMITKLRLFSQVIPLLPLDIKVGELTADIFGVLPRPIGGGLYIFELKL